MTTPVEVLSNTPNTTKAVKRKAPVKRSFNNLGKFFQKIRVDLEMTSAQWAKEIGVSTLTVSDIERGDRPLSFDVAVAIHKLLSERAPDYVSEFAMIIAITLGVLLIPEDTSRQVIEVAYKTLESNCIEQNVGATLA